MRPSATNHNPASNTIKSVHDKQSYYARHISHYIHKRDDTYKLFDICSGLPQLQIFILHMPRCQKPVVIMTMSSIGNIFRVTGPLCGEFTGEFPSQRPVIQSFDIFLDMRPMKQLNKQSRCRSFEMP